MRSAFSLQNQKCSATSRVYVERAVAAEFMERLLERTRAIRMGDPTERDVYFGPVINDRAVARYERAAAQARQEGTVLLGGARLRAACSTTGTSWRRPWPGCRSPARCSGRSCSCRFSRSVRWTASIRRWPRPTRADYGLTAGIFSRDPAEVERFFDEVEAGVCYANKRTGATTGAWPGAQPFTGWKGSGSSGKGGCGPYYVAQFTREQSRTVIT